MAEHSPGGFYPALAASKSFVDYPPGYLLVLWPIGVIAQAFGGGDPCSLATALIKIPPMLVDLVVGYVLYRLVLGWTWPGRRAEALALAAAALYVFNPVTMYDSALWGQTDSVGALVILLGVAALVRGNSEGAALLGTLAALVKPQFGVVLIPLVAVLLIRRHLLRPGIGPTPTPRGARRGCEAGSPASRAGRGWSRPRSSPWSRSTSSRCRSAWASRGYLDADGQHGRRLRVPVRERLQPLGADRRRRCPVLRADLDARRTTSGRPTPCPCSGRSPGSSSARRCSSRDSCTGWPTSCWRDERRTIIVAAVFLCLCFFVLPTRVHERYLLPVFALVPLLAVTSRAWLVALVALALGCLINLHAVLTIIRHGPNIQALPLGLLLAGHGLGIVLSVVLITGAFVFCAWRLWRGAGA